MSHRSALREFLASIATLPGDLSNITAPPFVLATKSTTEFPQYWASNPFIFVAAASEPDAAKRALLVLKWFLASLQPQQYAGRKSGEGVKKPLNAFLGEVFIASWPSEGALGETRLVSEQVSHHPPVTACYLWNEEKGIRASGYTRQSISLSSRGVHVSQTGHAVLHVDAYAEDYLVPLPSVTVRGLLSGVPYPELAGRYHITCSSGYVSEIEFSGRGFWSGGVMNGFTAILYRDTDRECPLYTVKGVWSGKFTFEDTRSGQVVEIYDTNAATPRELHVDPISEQDPWESRRAWAGVIDALNRGDMGATSREKGVVEQGQREMRKEELARGVQWMPAFFKSEQDDVVFEKLARGVGLRLEVDKTMGVWKVDLDAVGSAKKPFHGELTPVTYLGRSGGSVATRQDADGGRSSGGALGGWFRRRSSVDVTSTVGSKNSIDMNSQRQTVGPD